MPYSASKKQSLLPTKVASAPYNPLDKQPNRTRRPQLLNYAFLSVLVLSAYLVYIRLLSLHDHEAQPGPQVDVYFNGTVYTADSARTRPAGAFAVCTHTGNFLDVSDSVVPLLKKYPAAQLRNLHGRTVTPGLIDAHAHLMSYGYSLLQVDLYDSYSVEEVRNRILSFLDKHPETNFVRGRGWDQNKIVPDKSFPTSKDLDADPILKNIPIVLRRVDGHTYWINSKALEMANIPDDPIEGGLIVRDNEGKPTGIMVDNAMDLIDEILPEYTIQEKFAALEAATKELHKVGLTGLHDAGVPPEDIEFYKMAIKAGSFKLRNYVMIECPERNAFCGDLFPGHIRMDGKHGLGPLLVVRSVKMFMDGALGSWGAALIEPYSDDASQRGLIRTPIERVDPVLNSWIDKGFQVNVHCIGDLANKLILDSFEKKIKTLPPGADLRLRLEHAQILTLDDISRTGRLGVIASVQPTHATSDMGFAETRLGPQRIKGAYAWRSFLNASVPALPLGSDFPVEKPDFILGFYSAVSRLDLSGNSPRGPSGWFPEQRLTREEALKGFTYDASYASFLEHELGTISKGKKADFVIFDEDIMKVSIPQLAKGPRVLATVLAGHAVYVSDEGFVDVRVE